MRLVSENLLTKITRKQYSTSHGKLFELWDRYEDGEISTSKQAAEGLQCHQGTRTCCHFDFWLCGLIIFCHMKTDCVINANSKFQWKNIYTCRWLRLDEPLWTNWLHIPYNVNWSCDVALNAKQCRRQINNLIGIYFCKSATACALWGLWSCYYENFHTLSTM